MPEMTLLSYITLYILLALTGVFALLIMWWQIMVLKGKTMKNPDGSVDSWLKQPTHYGIAVADVCIACPAALAGIVLVFLAPKWGFYVLALVSFWALWANTMTTATSLRFFKPRINLVWFMTYPFAGIVGLLYIVWTMLHFTSIY